MATKLYSNKRTPEVMAKVVQEDEKYGTVLLEYTTGDNVGKTVNITKATLKRWWTTAGEIEEPEAAEQPKAAEEKKEPEFVTKVTPKIKKEKAVKVNKQDKIDYINILCGRNNIVAVPKNTHPDALRIRRPLDDDKFVNLGEIKINHTNFVLYTSRVIVVDESKFGCIVDKDSTGRAKIKFNLDDSALEYAINQLLESEDKKDGKN